MSPDLVLLAQSSSSGSAAGLGMFAVIMIAMLVFYVAIYVFFAWCTMRIFQRAGIESWYAWVPFVNLYGLWKMTNRDTLWLVLLFVPYANVVAQIVVFGDIARSFGKDQTWEWLLGLLGFVFLPILAFEKSPYLGPASTDLYPWSSRPSWYVPGPASPHQPAPGYGYGQPPAWGAPGQPVPGAAQPWPTGDPSAAPAWPQQAPPGPTATPGPPPGPPPGGSPPDQPSAG